MNKQITIVGTIPEPIGGVSVYLWRLFHYLNDFNFRLIDTSSNNNKYKAPSNVVVCNRSGGFMLLWELVINYWKNSVITHLHMSLPHKLLFLLVMKKPNKSKWVLTLHNGGLEAHYNSLHQLKRRLIDTQLKRFDKIICLSNSQYEFYSARGVGVDSLITYHSYIPPQSEKLADIPITISSFIQKCKKQNKKVILSSGYPRDIYNFPLLLNGYENELKDKYCLIIILYGKDRYEGYYKYIESRVAKTTGGVLLHGELRPNQFLRLQRDIDIYIRLTSEDSFGIAVADSVELNKTTLATDVCERYPGTVLIRKNEINDWPKKLIAHKKENILNNSYMNIRDFYEELYSID